MKWDYLSIRFSFKGLGIKQEFSILDVDGERVLSRSEQAEEAPGTLKDLLKWVGEDGWELVTHTIAESSGMQYMNFKRPWAPENQSPEIQTSENQIPENQPLENQPPEGEA